MVCANLGLMPLPTANLLLQDGHCLGNGQEAVCSLRDEIRSPWPSVSCPQGDLDVRARNGPWGLPLAGHKFHMTDAHPQQPLSVMQVMMPS